MVHHAARLVGPKFDSQANGVLPGKSECAAASFKITAGLGAREIRTGKFAAFEQGRRIFRK